MSISKRTLMLVALTALMANTGAAADNADAVAGSTADHGKFAALNQAFTSGPEVTKACLGCHTEAARQIHQTQHWNWEFTNPQTGQLLGKRHVINNFCTAVPSKSHDPPATRSLATALPQ